MRYVIRCTNVHSYDFGAYWNNVLGWVFHKDDASIFHSAEKEQHEECVALAKDGEWQEWAG